MHSSQKSLSLDNLFLIQALNSVRSLTKLANLGLPGATVDQELELCRALQKLLFQLLQLTTKLHEMIKSVGESAGAKVSHEIGIAASGLMAPGDK